MPESALPDHQEWWLLYIEGKPPIGLKQISSLLKMTYRVYVVELSRRVFTEHTRFRDENPQYNGVLECLYVGMTSKSPKQRFEQHKKGLKSKKGHNLSSSIVRKFGMYLRPSLYNHIPPVTTRKEALVLEEKLALDLRRERYAVWFG